MKDEGEKYKNIHQELIDKCRIGDSKAHFEIYRLYYKAMYNTCLRILGDPHEAEDVMQESFFKAFDKISSYRNEVSFGAWLRKIVVNSSLDTLKKRKINFSPIDMASGLKEDEDDEIDTESIEMIKAAMSQLPEGYRTVLTLYLVEEYDHEEIGQMLGITSSTSRSQYARARQKLIEILKQKK